MSWRNNPRNKAPIFYRFWSKVLVDTPDACWPWIGSLDKGGYGQFWMNNRMRKAPQVSWELTNGPIPEDMNILHRCDNPACVNIAHLFLGTLADNMQDKVRKKRHAGFYGEQRLGPDDVIAIRASADRNIDLAARYGVSASLICNIKKRRAWKHVEEVNNG